MVCRVQTVWISFGLKEIISRSSRSQMFFKISQYSQENTATQVFSCEYCEYFKNAPFFKEHLPWLLLPLMKWKLIQVN